MEHVVSQLRQSWCFPRQPRREGSPCPEVSTSCSAWDTACHHITGTGKSSWTLQGKSVPLRENALKTQLLLRRPEPLAQLSFFPDFCAKNQNFHKVLKRGGELNLTVFFMLLPAKTFSQHSCPDT